MRLPAACLLAFLLGAAGCASTATIEEPGRPARKIPADRETNRPTVPLKACLERGTPGAQRWLLSMFSDAGAVGPDCDLLVDASLTAYSRDLSFREAATGRPLFSVHSRFTEEQSRTVNDRVVAEVRERLADDGALFKTIARRSRESGAPAAAARAAAASPAPAAAPSVAPREEPAGEPDLLASPSYRAAERPDDLAVVVGIEDYAKAPKAAYAERDAEAFRAHARALGVPDGNIAFLTGASADRAALEKSVEQWLPRRAKADSRVYFFFAGRDAADAKTGQASLLPWDGDQDSLDTTAYPMKRLYEKLSALPAKQVFVALEAGLSGAGGAGRVTALTASAPGEASGALDAQKHGAFTYYLLQGLDGAAKDDSGKVTAKSLLRYLAPRVQAEARRLNRDQTPRLLGGDPDLVLR